MDRPECVEAVVFDFDGTLCDTEPQNLRLVQGVLRQIGAEVPMKALEVLTGGDDRVTVPSILEEYGATGTIDDYERLRDGCYRTYAEADLAPEPGVLELMGSLRACGVKLGVASMTPARCVLTALNRMGLAGTFDALVFGDMVEHRKPAPDPFLKVLGHLGVDPARAVAFEDSPTGIASAKAAGIYTIAYRGASVVQDVSAADEAIDTFVGFSL